MAEDKLVPPYSVPPQVRAQMMAQLALAWDGQWFLKVRERFGWQAAAEVNVRVRVAFAKLEMRATLRALGKRAADDLPDAAAVWEAYMRMFGGDYGAFEGEQMVEGDAIHIRVMKCAAWEGCKRADLEHNHQACMTCETVWQAWYGALLPGHDVSQQVVARMGYGAPECRFVVRAVKKT